MALHRQFLFFVTALLLTPWISWGEETPVTSEVITTPKGTLQLRLSDGRVAELHSKTAGVAHYPIDLKMTDNTCGTPRSHCRLLIPVDATHIALVWTVHPDAERSVNQ